MDAVFVAAEDLLVNQVFGMLVEVAKIRSDLSVELAKLLFAIAFDEFVVTAERMLELNEFVAQAVDAVTVNFVTKSAVNENFQNQEEVEIYLMSVVILIEQLVEIAPFQDQLVVTEL